MTIAFLLFFMVLAVAFQVVLFTQLRKLIKALNDLQASIVDFHEHVTSRPTSKDSSKNFERIFLKLDDLVHLFHRCVSMMAHTGEPINPVKPNNWDRMKEAFKGPQRTDSNERD